MHRFFEIFQLKNQMGGKRQIFPLTRAAHNSFKNIFSQIHPAVFALGVFANYFEPIFWL